jgi:hypothetical protein
MSNILNREFRYVPAAATDIRKTFARIRRQQKAEEQRRLEAEEESRRKVSRITRRAS